MGSIIDIRTGRPGHRLDVRGAAPRRRFYLEGREVHAGDALDVWTGSGWLAGRLEGIPAAPLFVQRDTVPGIGELRAYVFVDHARFRWPRSR